MLNSQLIDQKVEPVLRAIEANGVLLDSAYLNKLSKKIGQQLKDLEQKIFKSIGHEFNIDSPRQLASVLYDELQLDTNEIFIRKTKTHRSTSASELFKLKNAHPVIALIMEYRKKKKLKSTYLDPLPKLVDKSGRLHTTYAIDTTSGRLSSKNPNLQNIPIKTADGKKIRRAFIAPPGYQLLVLDYSQIQLRIAAHLSGDQALIDIFNRHEDVHAATAKKMGVERYVAKTINFGILFGQGAFGLAETLAISQVEAQHFIDDYFATFSTLKHWIEATQRQATKDGFVTTMFGRKRWLGEIKSPDRRLRAFAMRAAINHPLQGTEADIMKLAMIRVFKALPPQVKIILQVHDELVLEVPEQQATEKFAHSIAELMTSVVKLKVALEVNWRYGLNWAEV